MGRSPCCDERGLKKGPWTAEEDDVLVKHIQKHGHGSWRALPKIAGLNRCGKSCRLRWTNYLRPDIKRGKFSPEEEQTILNLHVVLGNKWSAISSHLSGRTDNEIKNFWNTHLKKRLIQMGFDPMTHQPRTDLFSSLPHLLALANIKDLLLDHHSNLDEQYTLRLKYMQLLLQTRPSYNLPPFTTGNFLSDNNNNLNMETPKLLMSSLSGSESSIPSIRENFSFSHLPDLENIPCSFQTSNLKNNDTSVAVLNQEDNSLDDSLWQLPALSPSNDALFPNRSLDGYFDLIEDLYPSFVSGSMA